MDLLNKIKDQIKDKIVLIVVGIILVIGNQLWSYIQAGAKADIDKQIESVVIKSLQKEDTIKELLKNPRFVKLILESEEVKEFEKQAGMRIRDEIVEQVTKSDTNKVSMRSFIGKEIGIRDEAVLPLLSELLNAYHKGDITTKEDVQRIVNNRIASF
jgi:hypothetical protein